VFSEAFSCAEVSDASDLLLLDIGLPKLNGCEAAQ